MTQAGAGTLAGEELALGLGGKVGEAQQAAVNENIDDVFDDADQVGVETGEIGRAGELGGVGMAVREFLFMARPGFAEKCNNLACRITLNVRHGEGRIGS